MEFPRVGLIRNKTTGDIICTWSYPQTEAQPGDTMTCERPLVEYDESLHEIVDLTSRSYRDYVSITDKQHEAVIERAQDKEFEWHLYRKDRVGPGRTPHEIGTVTEREERIPDVVDRTKKK